MSPAELDFWERCLVKALPSMIAHAMDQGVDFNKGMQDVAVEVASDIADACVVERQKRATKEKLCIDCKQVLHDDAYDICDVCEVKFHRVEWGASKCPDPACESCQKQGGGDGGE